MNDVMVRTVIQERMRDVQFTTPSSSVRCEVSRKTRVEVQHGCEMAVNGRSLRAADAARLVDDVIFEALEIHGLLAF